MGAWLLAVAFLVFIIIINLPPCRRRSSSWNAGPIVACDAEACPGNQGMCMELVMVFARVHHDFPRKWSSARAGRAGAERNVCFLGTLVDLACAVVHERPGYR